MWRLQRRRLFLLSPVFGRLPDNFNLLFIIPPTSSKKAMSTSSGAPAPPEEKPDYSTWSNSNLIARITDLERQLHSRTSGHATTTATAATTAAAALPPSIRETDLESASPPNKKLKKRALPSDNDNITQSPGPNRPAKKHREIDPSKYHTRFIALKFAYLGQRYNGFEHANKNVTPLPTIEEELWKALRTTRLIMPTNMPAEDDVQGNGRDGRVAVLNWEGCQYSKAGRTDRGVSAFGQVVGIRVRSARPKRNPPEDSKEESQDDPTTTADIQDASAEDNWDDVADELPYINMLNRILPEDIRVLAWCPHPPADFDARFSCRERQYRYFFTQPAFSPTPGPLGFAPRAADGSAPRSREGWLDIDAMREAAKHLEGVHDFRNFCKLDTSKQIENFERIIYRSDIEIVDPKNVPLGFVNRPGFQAQAESDVEMETESGTPPSDAARVYVFTLNGSAFLWHQVRHIVAILFLVAQGFESPSIVPELLDPSNNPRKPQYEMASDAPLVLWDCIFPDPGSEDRKDALEWIYAGNSRQRKSQSIKGDGKFGLAGTVDSLWSVWRRRKIDEILAGSLLELAVSQGDQSSVHRWGLGDEGWARRHKGQKVFVGSEEPRIGGKYIPVMEKRKMDTVEVQNARWRASKERKTDQASQS